MKSQIWSKRLGHPVMENKRIILDTNLWISFLITNQFTELDELIETDKIILIFSDELLAEFIDVVSRPKFKIISLTRRLKKFFRTLIFTVNL
jgi:hypothetical protein